MENALTQGILGSASALGMDPLDLATIISYETAGTFDPLKRGPVTQWGQHRGLIQYGEPQAKQYGVDWNNALASQLGPDGAVVRYFRDNGYQPGMGLLDAYSIVNAGAPGRYNASDANNGGAPGTVRDKVTSQMAGHRAKAQALLGGSYSPSERGDGADYLAQIDSATRPGQAPQQPQQDPMAQRMNALAQIMPRQQQAPAQNFLMSGAPQQTRFEV